jgi:hypothetical protein
VKHSRYAWILPAAAAIAVSIAVAQIHGRALLQSAALEDARRQFLELQRLQIENRRLISAQLSAEERKRLEAKHAEAEILRARLAELQSKTSAAATDADPNELSADDWVFSGRETPRAAIESVLWAASRGDVEQLASLLGFPPDVRAQAEEMFSKLPAASQKEYGSPERVVATLLAGSFPRDASGMNVLADKEWDQDAAISMSVEHSEGQSRTNVFRFHHASDGWRLMVPASVMSGYEKTLLGDQQPAEAVAP